MLLQETVIQALQKVKALAAKKYYITHETALARKK